MSHAGMLRASCETNDIDIDLRVVVDREKPCGVEHGYELIEFADALLAQDSDRLARARKQLHALVGDRGVIRAAAVVGIFQLFNRVMDTLGTTLGDRLSSRVKSMIKDFGIEPPPHWPTG